MQASMSPTYQRKTTKTTTKNIIYKYIIFAINM